MSRYSRIVHTRVKDKTLYILYQVVSEEERLTISPSSLINKILEQLASQISAATPSMQLDEDIASELLDDLLGVDYDNNQDTKQDPLESAIGGLLSGLVGKSSSVTIDDKQSPIEPAFKIRSNFEHDLEPEPEPELSPIPPWEGATPFTTLKAMSPKDAVIEVASLENNKILQRAVECVYSNIPREMWGTDKAQKLIADIIPIINKYAEKGIL